jgi:hypothetical protein
MFQSLGEGSLSFRGPPERLVAVEAEAEEAQTTIELVGCDRPGPAVGSVRGANGPQVQHRGVVVLD